MEVCQGLAQDGVGQYTQRGQVLRGITVKFSSSGRKYRRCAASVPGCPAARSHMPAPRRYSLYEMYPAPFAQAMPDNDASFGVVGYLSGTQQCFPFTSSHDQWVSVVAGAPGP